MFTDFHDEKGFVDYCLQNFGHLNKKDYELALFHLLNQGEKFSSLTDFEVSQTLRITESKVKQLRYEECLAFPPTQNNFYEEKLQNLLINCTFKFTDNGTKIQFCVNDKMLRLYLNDKLLKSKSFADSSFNTSIVTVSAKDIVLLISKNEEKEQLAKIYDELQANKESLPQATKNKLLNLCNSVIKDATAKIAPNITDWIYEQFNTIKVK